MVPARAEARRCGGGIWQEVPPADGASTPRGDKGAAAAKERRATMLSVVREVYADNGIMGFWKGVLPSLAMVGAPSR